MELWVTNTHKTILFLRAFPHNAWFLLYCTNKMDPPSWKTNKTLWFYWFLKLKPSFLLYCTKKTNHFNQKCCTVPKKQKKNNVSRPMALDAGPSQPGPLANGLETLFFLVFLVQYNTFGWNDLFFWYSTAKMKVWASKNNKTIVFYWFFKTAEPFYLYSTTKMELGVTKTNENTTFLWSCPDKAAFLLYRTNKMALPSWKTNKTLWFYWFFKMADPFYWYSTAKMELCTENISKT